MHNFGNIGQNLTQVDKKQGSLTNNQSLHFGLIDKVMHHSHSKWPVFFTAPQILNSCDSYD